MNVSSQISVKRGIQGNIEKQNYFLHLQQEKIKGNARATHYTFFMWTQTWAFSRISLPGWRLSSRWQDTASHWTLGSCSAQSSCHSRAQSTCTAAGCQYSGRASPVKGGRRKFKMALQRDQACNSIHWPEGQPHWRQTDLLPTKHIQDCTAG